MHKAVCLSGLLFTLLSALCLLAGCIQQPANDGAKSSANSTSSTTPGASAGADADAEAEPAREVVEVAKDKPVEVTAHFERASHYGQPGELSKLEFNCTLDQDFDQLADQDASIAGGKPASPATFELPAWQVQVSPVIDKPIKLATGKYGSYGGYMVKISNAEAAPLAVFEIDKSGKIARAAGQGTFELNLGLAAPAEQLYSYYVLPAGGTRSDPLMSIELKLDGFEPQSTTSDAGDSYEYRFPALKLTLRSSELAKTEQTSRGANQQHTPASTGFGYIRIR
jgi:hypothetical protein